LFDFTNLSIVGQLILHMKIDSQMSKILSNKISLFFGIIFFESVIFISFNKSSFLESNEIPAITNGPIIEPLPASSIPPKNN
jgi:hypothetical protein